MGAIWILQYFVFRLRSSLIVGVLTFLEKLQVGMGGHDVAYLVIDIFEELNPRDCQWWMGSTFAISSRVNARATGLPRRLTGMLRPSWPLSSLDTIDGKSSPNLALDRALEAHNRAEKIAL